MRTEEFSLGGLKVFALSDGYFHLDGGAMFGVVPKTLWGRAYSSDNKNRIKLAMNSLLIETSGGLVLVETGIGSKFDPKLIDLYEVSRPAALVNGLQALGYRTEDIDIVITSHLHFDHCGWNTFRNDRGEIVPTFPKARYVIQKKEWHDALHPNERDRSSYLTENFLPLEECGQLLVVDGDREIIPGIDVILAPGHTAGHQCVKIQDRGKTLLYLGDLVPTSAHIGVPYVMSYDLFPVESMKSKKRLYELAIAEDWTLAFVHDPVRFFGKVTRVKDKYGYSPLE
jgi:glyoxylase-like metal-dependent hydrolase (beta-lactamase superfamily II)